MKYLPLVVKNLLRKKTRTLLTVLSIAVALFLYGLLVTIHGAFYQGVEMAGADRLVVRNRTSLIMPLPISYKERMLQIDGVAEVAHATWFGGVYQDERNFFVQFAIEPEPYLRMYPEFVISKVQLAEFMRDRESCLAGRKLVERFGWKVGDRIPIKGTIWPGVWEFNLRAIYDGKRPEDDTTQFMFRYDYLDERRQFGQGTVGWYMVKVKNPDDSGKICRAIDTRFANSPYETVTEPEKVFMTGFVKQMGNIELLILSIGAVVLFTLLLVTGNTMAMAVRERIGEIGVLKTVGFSDRAVLVLVLGESMTIAGIGGIIGIGLAKLFTLGGDPTHGFLPVFYFPPAKIVWGLILATAVGLASGLVPAVGAMRLKIVDALRRV
ncbi:MAG: ABC transporter permease [Acidobacteriota bacterium]